MKTAVVFGAGGFIGSHMCRRLKAEGYFVRGLSRSEWNEQLRGKNPCDEYWPCDLRHQAFGSMVRGAHEVYQFACESGGLGYIMDHSNDFDMLRSSTMIDLNILDISIRAGVEKIFFASSACVYPNADLPAGFIESDAYPANPLNEFAWQKLFAERLYQACAKNRGLYVRIGRLFNTYGPGMPWHGGREKVVAALCRKIAESDGQIEVWGDGTQLRSLCYIDDTIEGIRRLMNSGYEQPLNIGPAECVSIDSLVTMICDVADKSIGVVWQKDKPVGVSTICCDTNLLNRVLDWEPPTSLEEGLKITYPWIEKQVDMRVEIA